MKRMSFKKINLCVFFCHNFFDSFCDFFICKAFAFLSIIPFMIDVLVVPLRDNK